MISLAGGDMFIKIAHFESVLSCNTNRESHFKYSALSIYCQCMLDTTLESFSSVVSSRVLNIVTIASLLDQLLPDSRLRFSETQEKQDVVPRSTQKKIKTRL